MPGAELCTKYQRYPRAASVATKKDSPHSQANGDGGEEDEDHEDSDHVDIMTDDQQPERVGRAHGISHKTAAHSLSQEQAAANYADYAAAYHAASSSGYGLGVAS